MEAAENGKKALVVIAKKDLAKTSIVKKHLVDVKQVMEKNLSVNVAKNLNTRKT